MLLLLQLLLQLPFFCESSVVPGSAMSSAPSAGDEGAATGAFDDLALVVHSAS
jgi:hypothetical protein